MYSVVLLAALTATEKAPAHGWTKHHGYGACYGGCYGACYAGWPHAAGGWGLPYGGYWAGYHGHGGYGYGMHSPVLTPAPGTYATPETKGDNRKRDKVEEKDDLEKDKKGKDDLDKDKKDDKKGKDDDNKTQARARLLFDLPQGANLYVDGNLIERAGERKSFRTPPLEKGEHYYYELRVEVVRDGRKFVENKKVTLAAGDVVKTDFSTVGTTSGVATAEPAR
jgi:uncharacterized protein (TIGR03000 family)